MLAHVEGKPNRSAAPPTFPSEGRARVIIEGLSPRVDGGYFPAKRLVGETLQLSALAFSDGHDQVSADALFWRVGDSKKHRTAMKPGPSDVWKACFSLDEPGNYQFSVIAWIDRWETWCKALHKRLAAGQDPSTDLLIGAALIREAAGAAKGKEASALSARAKALESTESSPPEDIADLIDHELRALMRAHLPRRFAFEHEPQDLRVDRVRAGYSTWYEMFPRSIGSLAECRKRLPYVAEMGFDVLYLPPIHPIGLSHRKGKNNATLAEKNDVGSPWAIGSAEGGHKAIHPDLGSMADFEALCADANERGIEVALDIAFQCSPDHPYVTEHPEWFQKRPDGSIQYAENPPKKYQDIFPLDFECEAWQSLWDELAQVFEHWVAHGVTIFRVDNPHTKPFRFWDWVIERVQRQHPEVIFLAEAFARPAVMYRLAKGGFTQSYTYFAWKNTKWELEQYFTELTQSEVAEYFRPNVWPNTPDILNEFLQVGGRPAFVSRLILAGTLSASYGIYGPAYELCEGRPAAPGSEEYLDSEKYQVREWNIEEAHSLRGIVARLNQARKAHPALQSNKQLFFHETSNDQIICYSKVSADGGDVVLCVVNLDPHHRQTGWLSLNLAELGIASDRSFAVRDLLSDSRFMWSGTRNFVDLDPFELPAHVFALQPRITSEADFDYFV